MSDGRYSSERRKYRRRLIFCPGVIDLGDRRLECQILEVSATGAKVRVGQDIDTEATIVLRSEIGDFGGDVVWRSDNYAGVRFEVAPERVAELVEAFLARPAHPQERRRHPRNIVLWAGRLTTDDQGCECVVLNVSLGGVKVVVKEDFPELAPILLTIERFGSFSGKVIWRIGEELGIQVDDAPETIARRIGPSLPEIIDET
jgi:hypothetical protein